MALRYQRQKLLADHAGVKTYQGIDPLTGLPVLIYAFAGKPHLLLPELESENIPGVLDSQTDAQQSYVVVAYAKGYQLASRPLPLDDYPFLIESAQALKDAAEIGVLHGDIRPERFWVSSDHVFVEGFGLPWTSQEGPYKAPEKLSSFAGDIYSWAKSALELTKPPLTAKPILDMCLHHEPNLRPTAEQVYMTLLKAKSQPIPEVPVNLPADLGLPTSRLNANTLEIDFTLSEEELPPSIPVVQPTMQGMPKPPSPSKPNTLSDLSDLDIQVSTPATATYAPATSKPSKVPSSTPTSFPPSFEEESIEPMVLQSDPGLRTPPKTQAPIEERISKKSVDPKQPFVKSPPPGATYRAGNADANPKVAYKDTPPPAPTFNDVFLKKETSRRSQRRTVLLFALVVASLILGATFFLLQRNPTPTTTSSTVVTNYIVDVAVEPAGMPPIDLRIISSPEGSSKRAGSVLAKVPGPIPLDQAGIWQFQGEFQDLRSEIVSLQLPEQRSITIVMPIPPVTPTEENPEGTPETTGEPAEPQSP